MELFEGKRKISIFVMDITYRYDKCVFFVPEFQDNILICIYYIFGGFYLLFLVVIPIYLLIKKKGFRITCRNFLEFLINILYYMCSQIYVMISGIVLGYVYVSWTKDLYILISAAYEGRILAR